MTDIKRLLENRREYIASLNRDLPVISSRVMSASPNRRCGKISRAAMIVLDTQRRQANPTFFKYRNFAVCNDELKEKCMPKEERKRVRKEMKDYVKISSKIHGRLRCFSPGCFNSKRLLEGKFDQFFNKRKALKRCHKREIKLSPSLWKSISLRERAEGQYDTTSKDPISYPENESDLKWNDKWTDLRVSTCKVKAKESCASGNIKASLELVYR
ncbi:unnamed protein product [Moneuplotes crassus]|uniref:Uncharacterized protein n=1 Tax=Euplotes crassus TaxID=5936 RepID=A0AAD2D5N8_EUPCR|nr:unnamed protein product [Moneuplotes crassus]